MFRYQPHARRGHDCVLRVYDEQNIQPSQYRATNITTAKPGDDYAAMREVLTRRYGKMQEAEANGESVKWPDVVLIDGGKGQIGVAVSVWEELGLHIPLVGIAKGPERKAGMEELILPFTGEVFRLPPNSPALHLLQTVRDESHRFAITGHRKNAIKHALLPHSAKSPVSAANAAKHCSPDSAVCAA